VGLLIACNNQDRKVSVLSDNQDREFSILSDKIEKINFWDVSPQRGANCMNTIPSQEWFQSASSINIKWVRLAYDKWEAEQRDFLIGDASNYNGLVQKDLSKLKEVLSWASNAGLKIVLTPLSLPGCRWSQNNGDGPDSRLWQDYQYQEMAIRFWVDLAVELKDYDCIVAYDILNEPYPERGTDIEEQTDIGESDRFLSWYEQYKNTPRDLFDFYNRIIGEIRNVDTETPIMVESGFYTQPSSYCGWPGKLEDSKVLYSVHMYEPYEFTSNNNFKQGGIYSYPGNIPFGNKTIQWNKNTIVQYFKPFENWAKTYDIPLNRIIISEFGCMRRNPGAIQYLDDIVSFLEERQYHWAFYSYREDSWDGYDYELGDGGLPWSYWQAIERRETPILPRKDTELFDIIKKRLVL
jgi:hypothetical protein